MSRAGTKIENICASKSGEESLSAIIYVGICLALFAYMFFPAYQYMFKQWDGEDYNHCYLIPLVVLYMLWEKRTALRNASTTPSWFGLIPLGIGVVMFWLGELGGEFYALYISSWFVMVGWLGLISVGTS